MRSFIRYKDHDPDDESVTAGTNDASDVVASSDSQDPTMSRVSKRRQGAAGMREAMDRQLSEFQDRIAETVSALSTTGLMSQRERPLTGAVMVGGDTLMPGGVDEVALCEVITYIGTHAARVQRLDKSPLYRYLTHYMGLIKGPPELVITNWHELKKPDLLADVILPSEFDSVMNLKRQYETLSDVIDRQSQVCTKLDDLALRIRDVHTIGANVPAGVRTEVFERSSSKLLDDIDEFTREDMTNVDETELVNSIRRSARFSARSKYRSSPFNSSSSSSSSHMNSPYVPVGSLINKSSPDSRVKPLQTSPYTSPRRVPMRPFTPSILRTIGKPGFRKYDTQSSPQLNKLFSIVRDMRNLIKYYYDATEYIAELDISDTSSAQYVLNDADLKIRRSNDILQRMREYVNETSEPKVALAIEEMVVQLQGALDVYADETQKKREDFQLNYTSDAEAEAESDDSEDESSSNGEAEKRALELAKQRMREFKLELDVLKQEAEVLRVQIEALKTSTSNSSARFMTADEYQKDARSWTIGELKRHGLFLPRVEQYMRYKAYENIVRAFEGPTASGMVYAHPTVRANTELALSSINIQYPHLSTATFDSFVNHRSSDVVINTLAALAVGQNNMVDNTVGRKQKLEMSNKWNQQFMNSLGPRFERMVMIGNHIEFDSTPPSEVEQLLSRRRVPPFTRVYPYEYY